MKKIQLVPDKELQNMCLEKISEQMNDSTISNEIGEKNWAKEFPYSPTCRFKIACSESNLYIKFFVKEKNVKASYLKDLNPVWKDSCVEFFCKVPADSYYFNFEFNCIGTCLASKRKSRKEDVIPLKQDDLQQIERLSSLNKTLLDVHGHLEWSLLVSIPFSLIGFDLEKGNRLNANFYKCGDETETPHYLSWSPIETETPDFHRPEFFGELQFE